MIDVTGIASLTAAADGVAPLDEATLLTVRHHPERVRTWGDNRGFGLLVGRELSLVVLPHHRGTGLGTRLLAEAPLPEPTPDGPVTAWSHGDHPAAAALAASHGWRRARELWVMRRPAAGLPPLGPAPDGVDVRGFRPGDESELLRVNAAAFAHHPEQGSLDRAGLEERMGEPWFDADGLIEAWVSTGSTIGGGSTSGERLLGFHWTKRHSETLGEVYVVGISPDAQGRGLGRYLTLAGLHHLAARSDDRPGVDEIHLYVEADNEPAVRLYSGLGFTHAQADTHVQYVRD
ncbi:mycothiol synthase [Nocardioides sp. KR10-350]|uniref:mycothiol synthase n=1 Tax=Nocardioides cheoyonin TaxID=3156615 RepID=UPI0032B4A67C